MPDVAFIHVNRHMIAANARDGGSRPYYTVKRGGKNTYAQAVKIVGGTVTLIDPREEKPLPCGARAYLKVEDARITLVDPCEFKDIVR